MVRILLTVLLLSFFLTAAFAEDAVEVYVPSEKNRLASSKSLDDRIRIYDTAFERIRKEMEKHIREDRFEDAARALSAWSALLSESLADIEKFVNTKKQSGRLRQYEISLRQAINGIHAFRMHVPIELYDALVLFEYQAENTRRKFIDFLFGNSD